MSMYDLDCSIYGAKDPMHDVTISMYGECFQYMIHKFQCMV